MKRDALVAFDVGAESGRAVLGTFDGERLAATECARFENRPVRLPDGLYWDALGLHDRIVDALHSVAGSRPRSIGIDTWGVDFALLDERGTLIANPLHHRDGRGAGAMERAFRRVGRERIYEVTGIQFMPINTVYQLLALEGSPALERAQRLLLVPDLFAYWLGGEVAAEATNASTTQLLDVRTGDWARDLIGDLELPARLLPPIVEAGKVLGTVRDDVAPWSPALVAAASHDTASAVVATPLASPGAAYISSGTWSLVGVELAEPLVGRSAMEANLTNERGFGGTIRLLKNVMGLWLVQECRRTWPDGPAPGYDELAELAAAAPAGGPLFDPDTPELLTPGEMPARIRSVCERTSGTAPGDMGALIRSVYESLACKYRLVLDEIEAATGRSIGTVHVIGGGAKNELLCRLTAGVTGRTVLAGPVEAAATGNLLVQLHALGELGSLADMREVVRRSARIVEYDPAEHAAECSGLYERYRTTVVDRRLEVAI